MAHHHHNVGKVYGYVIEEVIKNVREPFLNDGVDEQVLQELKQIWESKVSQSRAVQETSNEQTSRGTYLAHSRQQVTHHTAVVKSDPSASLTAPQQPQFIAANPQLITSPLLHTQILLPGNHAASVSHILPEVSKGNPPPLRPAYHGMPVIQPTRTQQAMQAPINQHGTTQQTSTRPSVIIQVDGPNDSDSEDDDDDDDDDSNDFSHDDNEDGEDKPEEDPDPLNSDDDVSDEDTSDLFDTDNVVVCQFDRITRSKNKWKFHLKDGIMNLNGRDYVFQKANGEAEW